MTFEDWINITFCPIDNKFYIGSVDELYDHCLHFMDDPLPVIRRFSRSMLVRVFTVFPSIDGYLGILASNEISFDKRKLLANAHAPFYRKVFYEDDYEGSGFMWWEWLAGASFNNGPDVSSDSCICDVILLSIRDILSFDSAICQLCALHGVNEIGPFGSKPYDVLVRQIIDRDMLLTNYIKKYADMVISGGAP